MSRTSLGCKSYVWGVKDGAFMESCERGMPLSDCGTCGVHSLYSINNPQLHAESVESPPGLVRERKRKFEALAWATAWGERRLAKWIRSGHAPKEAEGHSPLWVFNRYRRLVRAYHRFCKGTRAYDGRCPSYVLLTLTTPDDVEVDLHSSWRKLILRLRRRGLRCEYFGVREWNKKGTCQHLHVVLRANFIEIALIRAHWSAVVDPAKRRTIWCHIKPCGDMRGMANYLAKYMSKGILDERLLEGPRQGRLYWYAYTWLCRCWRWYNHQAWLMGEKVQDWEHAFVRGLPREVGMEYMVNRVSGWMTWKLATHEGIPLKVEGYPGEDILVKKLVEVMVNATER